MGAFLVGPIRQGSVPRPLGKPGATLAVDRSNWFASSEREFHLAFLEKLAELDVELPWITLPIAALATGLLATLSGLAASLRALAARPMDTLRG